MKPSTRRKTPVRRRAPEPAQSRQIEPLDLEEPPPSLSAPHQSFHVKHDNSPRGMAAQEQAAKTAQIAKVLLDTIVTLCDDEVLSWDTWEKTIIELGNLVDGTE